MWFAAPLNGTKEARMSERCVGSIEKSQLIKK